MIIITKGPTYLFWEQTLERLKVLDYETGFCTFKKTKEFSRVHFVFPGPNLNNQFEEFTLLCEWLCTLCKDSSLFKKEQYDDPGTVTNKLMLALRTLQCTFSFPAQKLKIPHGEIACSVLDFLSEKALAAKGIKWGQPQYPDLDAVCIILSPFVH